MKGGQPLISMASDRPSSRRQASATAPAFSPSANAGPDARARSTKRPRGVGLVQLRDRACLGRQGQRALAIAACSIPERRTAGRQDPWTCGGTQDPFHRLHDRSRHMLAVVQQEQRSAAAERPRQRRRAPSRSSRSAPRVRTASSRTKAGSVTEARSIHQTPRELGPHPPGHLERRTQVLDHPGRSGVREPTRLEELRHLLELAPATDDVRRLGRLLGGSGGSSERRGACSRRSW